MVENFLHIHHDPDRGFYSCRDHNGMVFYKVEFDVAICAPDHFRFDLCPGTHDFFDRYCIDPDSDCFLLPEVKERKDTMGKKDYD